MKISYSLLDPQGKEAVLQRLLLRKKIYLNACQGIKECADPILLIGDRPGPSAPKDLDYHHTPFYSVKHCSGWLNAALHLEQIPEHRIVWINSADKDGIATDVSIVERISPKSIIALGGNASTWLKVNGVNEYILHSHPQYHKRFRNAFRYSLLDDLKALTLL